MRSGAAAWVGLVFAGVLLGGTTIQAQDCERPGSVSEMQECANLRFRAAERELARVEDRLAASEGEGFREALREAQRTWRVWREAEGRLAEAATEDPGLAIVARRNAEAQLTEDRIKDLRGYTTGQ